MCWRRNCTKSSKLYNVVLASVVMMRPPSQSHVFTERLVGILARSSTNQKQKKHFHRQNVVHPYLFFYFVVVMVIFVLPPFPNRDLGGEWQATETRPSIGLSSSSSLRFEFESIAVAPHSCQTIFCSTKSGSCSIGRKPKSERERERRRPWCTQEI